MAKLVEEGLPATLPIVTSRDSLIQELDSKPLPLYGQPPIYRKPCIHLCDEPLGLHAQLGFNRSQAIAAIQRGDTVEPAIENTHVGF